MNRFEGRTAVVTGGGSGIGLATVRRLAAGGRARGRRRRRRRRRQAAAAKEVDGLFVRTDVTAEADVEALFAAAVETYGTVDVAFNNAGHLPARGRLDPHDRARRLAAGAGGQPDLGVPVLPRGAAAHAAPGQGLDHQHGVVRGGDGRGDVADLLHRVEGRGAGDVPGAGRAVRPRGDPGQRAVPRPGRHPAAAGAVRLRPRARAAAAGAHPDGPVRPRRGDRRHRRVPGQRRRELHHREHVPGRRRHLRRLRHPAVRRCSTSGSGSACTTARRWVARVSAT